MKQLYVTASLLEAARKAKAVTKADARWFAAAPRSARNSKRYRAIAAAVRAWAAADSAAVPAAKTAAVPAAVPAADSADRVAALVARRNEIGAIPPVRHRRLRERCRLDLELFGWTYCRDLLDHRASPLIRDRLVRKMQDAMLNGGQLAVEASRGIGKTTWTIIAIIWAIVYGHRRFLVCISASSSLAKNVRRAVFAQLSSSDALLADFPAVPTALRKMNGAIQKGLALTYLGRNVGFESGEVALVLPDLRDETNRRLDHACGAILACRGVGGSVRGLNVRGERPDFVLFDDPQTQKDALSASAIQRVDSYIHADALNLAANTATMAAFMTITPQRPDDLAQRIADRALHPNWSITNLPFLVAIPDGFDEAADDFAAAYAVDAANDDFTRAASRAWYADNRARFDGALAADPRAFDPATESDAVHHALNRIAAVGRDAFYAEYQMLPVRQAFAFELTDRLVLSRVRRGVNPGVLPPNTVLVAAATDINPSYALTTAVVAFDVRLTAQVVAYRIHRCRISENLPEVEFDRRVYEALAAAARAIAEWGLRIDRWGIDAGGNQFRAVTAFAPNSRQLAGIDAIPMTGRGGRNWNPFVRSRIREARDGTVPCRDQDGRFWLAWDADALKERAQRAWLAEPGAPGGLSLFDGRVNHAAFAVQVSNERIKSKTKTRSFDGRDRWAYVWDTREPHDYGDCLAMCYALAAADGLNGNSNPPRRKKVKYVIE